MIKSNLTEKEELILMSFLDRETGTRGGLGRKSFWQGGLWQGTIWQDRTARKLLASKPEAREFLESLNAVDQVCRSQMGFGTPSGVHCDGNLWERVVRRIQAEEKSELFLGRREVPGAVYRSSLRDRLGIDWKAWSATVAVAGTALAAFLFVVVPQEDPQGHLVRLGKGLDYMSASQELNSSPLQSVSSSSSFLPEPQVGAISSSELMSSGIVSGMVNEGIPASFGASQRATVPLDSFEVDWVKSHGRVKLIQDADGRSAIVWIKKREPLKSLMKSEAGEIPGEIPGEIQGRARNR